MSWQDPLLIKTLFLTLCVGLFSGLMGSFVVLKRISLLQDVLGHAVFPGVLLGFILTGKKDHPLTYLSAFVVVLFASFLIQYFSTRSSPKVRKVLSYDSAQGIVLVGAFSFGIYLFSYIDSRTHFGIDKNGLKDFMFGQLAAVTVDQTVLLFCLMFAFVLFVGVGYRTWALSCFDPLGARIMGVPLKNLEGVFFVFQALFITVALQAAGLVLVAGFLVIPAAISLLIAQRGVSFILFSALVGGVGTLSGSVLSLLNPGIPTGPSAVLVMFLSLVLVLLFIESKKRFRNLGKHFFKNSGESHMRMENSLKAIYQWYEMKDFTIEVVTTVDLAAFRNVTLKEASRQLDALLNNDFVVKHPGKDRFSLTSMGWKKAFQIVRAHRLWELYLISKGKHSESEVHLESEFVEHGLSQKEINEVESTLNFPQIDPHGKVIPGAWARRARRSDEESN